MWLIRVSFLFHLHPLPQLLRSAGAKWLVAGVGGVEGAVQRTKGKWSRKKREKAKVWSCLQVKGALCPSLYPTWAPGPALSGESGGSSWLPRGIQGRESSHLACEPRLEETHLAGFPCVVGSSWLEVAVQRDRGEDLREPPRVPCGPTGHHGRHRESQGVCHALTGLSLV